MDKFLRKYSTVPNEFIDDFFGIVNENQNDDDMVIKFDNVVKWLDVRKNNLKRLLVKYWIKNIDYIVNTIKVNNKNNQGSNYIEEIWLTPDCFKELCMISLTPKAKEVRSYYLSLEKLIKKYHTHIQEKLNEKIKLLETNQKPKINKKGGVIYFFRALNNINIDNIDKELLKIGKTKNAKKRFSTYNSGNANDIEPLFMLEVNDIGKVEKCIKNLLEEYQYRRKKEIYQINVSALKTVFIECESLVDGFKNYMNNTPHEIANRKFQKMRNSDNGIIMYLLKK